LRFQELGLPIDPSTVSFLTVRLETKLQEPSSSLLLELFVFQLQMKILISFIQCKSHSMELTLLTLDLHSDITNNHNFTRWHQLVVQNLVVHKFTLQAQSFLTSLILRTSTVDSHQLKEMFHLSTFLLSMKTKPQLCVHRPEDGAEVML
jgi:hypothetical protein